jgi:molybdopterin converting factor small subunit
MRVLIPSSLRSYTGGEMHVQANGATLGAVLADLDRQYAGLRFRMIDEQGQIRPQMRVFIAGMAIHDLAHPLQAGQDVDIVQALSGG